MAQRTISGLETLGTDLVNNWNIKTVIEMIQYLDQATQNADEQVRTALQNQINTVKQQLDQAIQNLQSEIDEVRTLAEILTDAEKGQLEQILDNVFKTMAQEGLLNRLCVTLPDGQKASLQDVLIKVLTRPEIKKEEYIYDETGKDITSVKVVLTDSYTEREEVLTRQVQNVTDNDGNVIAKLYIFKNNPTDNYYQLVKQIKIKEFNVPLRDKTYTYRQKLSETRFVIDLQFANCPYSDTVNQAIDKAADINQDGVIGDNTQAQTGNENSGQNQQQQQASSNTSSQASDTSEGGEDV